MTAKSEEYTRGVEEEYQIIAGNRDLNLDNESVMNPARNA